MNSSVLIEAIALAALLTAGATPLVMAFLVRRGVIDSPNHRSSHSVPTPRGGGLAVAVGVGGGLAALAGAGAPWPVGVATTAAAFSLLGLVEDLWGVGIGLRLVAQVLVGSIGSLALVGALHGSSELNYLWAVFGAFWLVGYVNAFNFMDGINGISVVQVAIACGYWIAVGLLAHNYALAALAGVTAGAAVGFGPFNLPRAKIFLGDIGSYGLGSLLAGGVIVAVRSGLPPEAAAAPLLPYLADTASTIVRRMLAGEKWYEAHRSHAYQRLVGAGWSHVRTASFVGITIVASTALGAVSLLGWPAMRVVADGLLVVLLAAYVASPAVLSGGKVMDLA